MQTLTITATTTAASALASPVEGNLPWLSILIGLPALVGILTLALAPLRVIGRWIALSAAGVELVLAIIAATTMNWNGNGAQLAETYPWIPRIGISWALGVTQLGMVMILLAAALVPLVLVAAWNEDNGRRDVGRNSGTYAALILVLEAFMVMIFAARDVAVFYIAFEAMLIPLYFMVGRYGQSTSAENHRAAIKFLLYSLFGGLVMLGGLIGIYVVSGGGETAFLVENLAGLEMASNVELAIFVTFFIAFAIKAPMVPVHTWLPDTAAVARPGTSALLVGVLDKIGTYGMLALCLPLFPHASAQAAPVIITFALISIIWGGLAAIGQRDVMRLVSFTSVSHFGFMVLGIYVGSHLALVGAMFYMVAHGVSIAAMFLISGFLAERGNSRTIADYQGMQRVTPLIAGTWLVAGLASVALPGLSGFVPEYLVLVGTWSALPAAALVAVLGVVIAACYLLLPYKRMFTGPVPKAVNGRASEKVADLNWREKTVVAPLLLASAVLGIWSAPLVNALNPVAETALAQLNEGQAAVAAQATEDTNALAQLAEGQTAAATVDANVLAQLAEGQTAAATVDANVLAADTTFEGSTK
ncbi:MAG: NADH-quinone oxidoreductase subunit M [Actinomycetaceae bacterium]|nr:NADH-quinone oxidoreductase subunit M [Actinomycetaceae bacterium]